MCWWCGTCNSGPYDPKKETGKLIIRYQKPPKKIKRLLRRLPKGR